MPIIQSLLEQDLYKFSMQQVVLHQFPEAEVEYAFKCRNKPQIPLSDLVVKIKKEIKYLCTLRFTESELDYLSKIRFLKRDYIEYLRLFKLDEKFIEVTAKGADIEIRIKGPWLITIMFEVPVLAIVNETYSMSFIENNTTAYWYDKGYVKLKEKIELIKNTSHFIFSDFGLRRRFCRIWQDELTNILKAAVPINFIGTSNVYLAKKYDLIPVGTMAHEFIMAMQTYVRLIDSQKYALQCWANEYRGDLGIALSDTLGFDAFLKDFDLYFAKLFDGCRQDSGDPFEWCDKLIAHYEKLKIDPRTKRAVFSDGLDFPKALAIADKYKDRIQVSFGIGTNLTNCVGVEPLQIVIKMTRCNGQPVAKISDSSGKGMCEDQQYLNYLKSVFKIKGE